jgi:hypothetical protein
METEFLAAKDPGNYDGCRRAAVHRDHPTGVKPEGVLKFWGVYKLTVGVLAAAESLSGMLRSTDLPATSVWGAITLAAAVLLAIDGLTELFARVHGWVFVSFAAVVPIAISLSSGDWPEKLWMYAVALGFVEWVFQELKRTTARTEIGTLACCAALGISLANTTFMLFKMYWDDPQFWPLGQIFKFMTPIALPWTLVLILLAHSARDLRAKGSNRTEEGALATEIVKQ